MIADIMALARDVDRLFRARHDGMPVGIKDAGFQGMWRPVDEEQRAFVLFCDIAVENDLRIALAYYAKARFRTRRHVAMLALTEPAHFRACLAEADQEPDVKLMAFSTCPARSKIVQRTFGWSRIREIPYPSSKRASDVARTARYLIDLDARLTEWREAEAVRAAIEARKAEIAEQDSLVAVAQEPIPQEDEDAILAMA